MSGLLSSDLFKLRKSRSFLVCIIVAFILGAVMSVTYYIAYQELSRTMEQTMQFIEGLGNYSGVVMETMDMLPTKDLWSYVNVSLCDQNVLYIAAIAIGIFAGSEYSMGTVRNSLTRGFSRNAVFFSKLICVSVIMLSIAAVYVLGSSIPACIMFGFTAAIPAVEIIQCLLIYALLFIAAAGFYMLLAVVTKKTGYGIALAILLPIVITALINVIKIGNQDLGNISRFWLFETITVTQKLVHSGEWYIPALTGAAYSIITILTGLAVFRKQSIN